MSDVSKLDVKLTPFHGHLIVQQEGVRIVQTERAHIIFNLVV